MVGPVHQHAGTMASLDPRLHQAAQEFEAMLLADMMKLATDQNEPDGESDASCHGYDELRNQAVATALSRQGGIGIANLLLRKIGPDNGIKDFSSSADSTIAGINKGGAAR